jgi:hypothetical protein
MQNSQLHRRGFVAPKDSEALAALRASNVSGATAVEHAEIPTQEAFDILWKRGFFAEIRERTISNIDDYEETEIEASQVRELTRLAKRFSSDRTLPEAARNFCEALAVLGARAESSGMPVFANL